MKKASLCLWLLGYLSSACAFDASIEPEDEVVAELSEGLVRSALTDAQQAKALKLIDDICGDTWCEGDHNFSFDRLECRAGCARRAGSCKLTFRVFSYDTDVETGPTYVRSCTTSGFTGFASLVQTTGAYPSLQPEYYSALTTCIGEVESQLPTAP
jgi:hypothetical protein